MKIIDCEQGTEEWFNHRLGIPTASKFSDIVTSKGAISKSLSNYAYKLAGERISGKTGDGYQSFSMQRGTELEPEARELFSFIHGPVEQVGLCLSDCGTYSCSPDGLMREKRQGLEVKCPELHTHAKYLYDNKLPTTYFQQVQGSLYVTGYEMWWFMSYYPGMEPLIIKVLPDVEFHMDLAIAISSINKKVEDVIKQITKGRVCRQNSR